MNEKKNTEQVFEQTAKEFGEAVGVSIREVKYISQDDKWWLSQKLDTLTGDHTTLVVIDCVDDLGSAIVLRGLIDLAIASKKKHIAELSDSHELNSKTSELVDAKVDELVKFLSKKKDTSDCPDKIQETIDDLEEIRQTKKDIVTGLFHRRNELYAEIDRLTELRKTEHITRDNDDDKDPPEDGTEGVVA